MTPNEAKWRWFAVCVLVLSSALNYLDRMVLSALMPTLQAEFHLSREHLGNILAAFSLVYGLSSPLAGLLIDRIGLRSGAALVVGLWSSVGIATGFAGTFFGLLVCRTVLGAAEAGGIPATGKGFALYLQPRERALGTALNQVGITLGSVAAPVLTEWFSGRYGWRSAFLGTGLLGFVWVPFWLAASSRATPLPAVIGSPSLTVREMLADHRLLVLGLANGLAMTVYSLWTQWMTLFLVTGCGLSQQEANLRLAWIPPIFATAGALTGGFLALRLIRSGANVLQVRLRISLVASVVAGVTAFAPMFSGAGLATAAISLSLAAITCLSVNYYAIPLDLFGASRAAFAVSMLTAMYGLVQAFLSPQIGRWSEKLGWQPVCLAVSVLPFVSVLLLRTVLRRP